MRPANRFSSDQNSTKSVPFETRPNLAVSAQTEFWSIRPQWNSRGLPKSMWWLTTGLKLKFNGFQKRWF